MQDDVPLYWTLVSAAVFFVIAVAFFVHDLIVHKRNIKIVDASAKSNAIILSLFPAKVREQLLAQKNWGNDTKENVRRAHEEKDPTRLFDDLDSTDEPLFSDSPLIVCGHRRFHRCEFSMKLPPHTGGVLTSFSPL